MDERARPDALTVAAFLAVSVFGGLNAIAVKATVRELDPFWGAGMRFMLAGLLLAAFVVVARRAVPRGASLRGAATYGLLAFSASYGFIYPALREVPAATAMVFVSLVPLETFLLAVAQRQERFRIQGLVGALVSLAGVVVVVWDQLGAAIPLAPMFLLLIGTLFIAESAIVLKRIPRADPYGTNAVAMLVGGAILLALSALTGESWAFPASVEAWTATAYLVLFGSIGLFGLYLFAMQRWTASAVSYTTLLMPLVTVPVAAVLLGEAITPAFVIGLAIALAGVYVGAFLAHRPNRSTATAAPECLPIDDCPPAPVAPRRAPAAGSDA